MTQECPEGEGGTAARALSSQTEALKVLGVAGASLVHSSMTGPFAVCCRVRVSGCRGIQGSSPKLNLADKLFVHAECAGDFAKAPLADRAVFVFVCIHSGTEVTLTLRQPNKGGVLGSVTLPAVPHPPFGFMHDEWGAAALADRLQWLPLREASKYSERTGIERGACGPDGAVGKSGCHDWVVWGKQAGEAGPGEDEAGECPRCDHDHRVSSVPHWRRAASSLSVNYKHTCYAARGPVVGEVLVHVSYESLVPGCEDGGSYFGPDVVVLDKASTRSAWDVHPPLLGAPNHRICAHDNLYVVPDEEAEGRQNLPLVRAVFGYGFGSSLLRTAARQTVVVGMRDPDRRLPEGQNWFGCSNECHCASVTTSSDGSLSLSLPRHLVRPCRLAVRAIVKRDLSQTRGSLYLLRPGTPVVVFDVDGTLTTGDAQVVGQFAAEALAGLGHTVRYTARAGSLTCTRLWAARGYQPVYLCGGQGTSYGLRYEWLINAGFPPGPLHLTESSAPTLPIYASVGTFKLAYLKKLQGLGLKLHAAYGNTESDLRAYRKAGIPQSRTFYVEGGGAMAPFAPVRTPCTSLGTDFTRHNAELASEKGVVRVEHLAHGVCPPAAIRIPYSTLEI